MSMSNTRFSRRPLRVWRHLASLLGLTLALAQPAKAASPATPAPQAKVQQAKGKAQAARKSNKLRGAKATGKARGAKTGRRIRTAAAQPPELAPTQPGPALLAAQPGAVALAPEGAASAAGASLEAPAVAVVQPVQPVQPTQSAQSASPLRGFRTTEAPAIWSFVDRRSGQAFLADEPVDERYRPILHADSHEGWRVPRSAGSRQAVAWMESAPEVQALQPLLDKAEAATGVDADLLKAIIMVESRFQPRVVSRDGATGLMQISPRTADTYATAAERSAAPARQRLKEPEHNIMTGARLLADLFKRLGHVDVALAAWNAGEGKVRRAGNQVPQHPGVRNHIRKVLEIYWGLLQRREQQQRPMPVPQPVAAHAPTD